jgi:hypothetical protein
MWHLLCLLAKITAFLTAIDAFSSYVVMDTCASVVFYSLKVAL